MTAPTARKPRTARPAPEAPTPEPQPEPPRWPAVGADAETLRSMPGVAYLWTEPVPAADCGPIITAAADKAWRDASAAMRALRGMCHAMTSDWEAKARQKVFGPLDEWLTDAIPAPPALDPLPEVSA